jgi:hypothetical protein
VKDKVPSSYNGARRSAQPLGISLHMSETALAILRKVGSRIALIASVLFVLFAAQWLVFRCPLPFVASLWNRDSYDGTTFHTRYRIADGLELSGHLKGKARAEVLALLGPPPKTDKFPEHGLVYRLGPGRVWTSLDYEWLRVDFDSDGRVTTAEVVSD